jgi:hypothetical protein
MSQEQHYFIAFDTSAGCFLSCLLNPAKLLAFEFEREAFAAIRKNESLLAWITLQPFVIAMPKSLGPHETLAKLGATGKCANLSNVAVRNAQGLEVDRTLCKMYEVVPQRTV